MTARAIMLMGTGSDVGKSLIAAGLCRMLSNRGMKVKPFKPQNMSNNAAVTIEGGEIGRAQALQARAARIDPSVHMNPVLLKPESGSGAQVIIQGKRFETLSALEYFRRRLEYLPAIMQSFRQLSTDADIIIVEGAGSPAELNLREGDLANMGFATAADIDAILIGDIHRGGVIASITGTFHCISNADRRRLKGFLINNFHGDPQLFSEGVIMTEQLAQAPCLGVVPNFPAASKLPAEDSLALSHRTFIEQGSFHIAVPSLPRIANFDDLDPLRLELGVTLRMVAPGRPIPICDLIIIPGSKSTVADLTALRSEGWDIDILAHARQGGAVLGLCGGYQMLGRAIHDPEGIEGPRGSAAGLGLLDVDTTLLSDKALTRVEGTHVASCAPISGYEIHLGNTVGADCGRPFARIGNRPDGATSPNGRVAGTYLHGCFSSDRFRSAFLSNLGAKSSTLQFDETIETTLDGLAIHLENNIDIDRVLSFARVVAT